MALVPTWKLKRHPLKMQAHFSDCLVITYALPAASLTPLLPPGLELDTFGDYGFVAVALVKVHSMKPTGLPLWPGTACTLAGYRVFTRFCTPTGKRLRGLRILRSETNNFLISLGGNLMTHYNYHRASCAYKRSGGELEILSRASDGLELRVIADTARPATCLPAGSAFPDFTQARRFAGPLPFTFDYEPQTHSIVSIFGRRPQWNPVPVNVDVTRCDFLDRFDTTPVLSNAFYVSNIDYAWERGVVYPLDQMQAPR